MHGYGCAVERAGAVCPRAPLRRDGDEWVRSWYTYFTQRDGCMLHDEIDEVEFWEQVARVHRILWEQTLSVSSRAGIPCAQAARRVAVGGESQGGTVALWAAMTFRYRLGAVLAVRTVHMHTLPPRLPVLHHKVPLHVFSGERDSIYMPALQRLSLRAFGGWESWHVERGVGHCDNCDKSIESWFVRCHEKIIYGRIKKT